MLMRMRRRVVFRKRMLGFGLALVLVSAVVACASDGGSTPVDPANEDDAAQPPGSEGAACFATGTCVGTLTCVSDVCVDLAKDPDATTPVSQETGADKDALAHIDSATETDSD
jgi:hypothetical protein